MDLGIVLSVFAIIAIAELPDKTMIATLIMGSRGQPLWVWFGTSLGFLVHVVIATLAGQLLTKLPHTTIEIFVTILFFGGAAWLLFVPEKAEEERGEQEAEAERPGAGLKVMFTSFMVIFIGEWGDLTQLLIASFVASKHAPLSVAVGSGAALVMVAGLACLSGRALLRVLPLQIIRRAGGVILLGFGTYTSYRLLTG